MVGERALEQGESRTYRCKTKHDFVELRIVPDFSDPYQYRFYIFDSQSQFKSVLFGSAREARDVGVEVLKAEVKERAAEWAARLQELENL